MSATGRRWRSVRRRGSRPTTWRCCPPEPSPDLVRQDPPRRITTAVAGRDLDSARSRERREARERPSVRPWRWRDRQGTVTATDLVVAGGGPAGLATAIRARMCGLRVVVLDPLKPPVDRACGEGLMPDGLERLEELGIDTRGSSRCPFSVFAILKPAHGGGAVPGRPGRGIRRTRLHRLWSQGPKPRSRSSVGYSCHGMDDGGFNTDDGPVRPLVGRRRRPHLEGEAMGGTRGRRSQVGELVFADTLRSSPGRSWSRCIGRMGVRPM